MQRCEDAWGVGIPFPLDWISQVYLPENHARLKAAHTYVSEELRALGIPFVSRGAGFFIWVDLRKVNRGEVWVSKKPSLHLAGEGSGGSNAS